MALPTGDVWIFFATIQCFEIDWDIRRGVRADERAKSNAKLSPETAALGLPVLRERECMENTAPGTQIEVQIKAPTATHVVTLAQLRRWVDGVSVSPHDTLKEQKLKELCRRYHYS